MKRVDHASNAETLFSICRPISAIAAKSGRMNRVRGGLTLSRAERAVIERQDSADNSTGMEEVCSAPNNRTC